MRNEPSGYSTTFMRVGFRYQRPFWPEGASVIAMHTCLHQSCGRQFLCFTSATQLQHLHDPCSTYMEHQSIDLIYSVCLSLPATWLQTFRHQQHHIPRDLTYSLAHFSTAASVPLGNPNNSLATSSSLTVALYSPSPKLHAIKTLIPPM